MQGASVPCPVLMTPMPVEHPARPNPEVIPLAASLCQHMRLGGTCRAGFYSKKRKGEVGRMVRLLVGSLVSCEEK